MDKDGFSAIYPIDFIRLCCRNSTDVDAYWSWRLQQRCFLRLPRQRRRRWGNALVPGIQHVKTYVNRADVELKDLKNKDDARGIFIDVNDSVSFLPLFSKELFLIYGIFKILVDVRMQYDHKYTEASHSSLCSQNQSSLDNGSVVLSLQWVHERKKA